ncbi:UDP-N-acetylglucosamine diphosphorylase/glucosamine-1-phosphate N-acetyltransferase [Pacificimonas flava]|uniref:Bifunctional protein GlmU n=2 Tax=Pacificimonas TaxID=1960290 RepID=A0A219B6H7_9SPHN|nr:MULTISPECIES: bifunctional UDP-N-acetylglucosamine diphosphorylase/glucosamine-1-phosphate N-acetyltransferase GlmU [Pacificimonas]MBZ6378781.1 bifunctional UDP-N-acetylglucosamine diphosphorylase/glucosamine-1-phosphate N-acetyltransferase GlmU [Pacificimonas aurantium]OWV33957.1 UDP-N-acetylglucosamine diphosphorylase/glucosamine-1-phosphate N-acetyltransferase [Pacificimonas flava]
MGSRSLAVVILAAGKGTRMKSELHKVLHPVGGRPMLLGLIDELRKLDLKKSVVVVGAGGESVRSAAESDDVLFAEQTEQLGTAHAALMARDTLKNFTGDVLVCFGDVPLLKAATVETMQQRLAAEDRPASVVLGFRPADPKAYGRVIADEAGRIRKMVEFKDASPEERACDLCNAGPLMARGEELFDLLSRISNDNAQGEYYLPDVVTVAAADGRDSAVVEAPEAEVAGVNDRRDLSRAEALWQEEQREHMMMAGVSLRAPETVYFSYDTRIEPDVVVEPHVVFGPGVRVDRGAAIRAFSHLEGAHVGPDCEVGPYARLRPGAKLERGAKIGNFVEMKKAVLGEGAKANHLTYLGDAEVGPRANIGAGTITCNYDGYFKYKTEIGAEAFIGSNSALVAPVRIGDGAIVGAGSTVTEDVEAGDLRLERAAQASKSGWAARFRKAMQEKKSRSR